MDKIPHIIFATSNNNKLNEVRKIFERQSPIKIVHLNVDLIEIQSDDLEKIAISSLKSCYHKCKDTPTFVEDSGIFIKALNNFPGPYSAYVYRTIGLKGIMTLMQKKIIRNAYFQSLIALRIDKDIYTFSGKVEGKISNKISKSGWGYDPIFVPDCDGIKTFGELGDKKIYLSHRYHSTIKLLAFLEKLYFREE
jgi:XTP/dITP diphosphohydrolase